MGLGVQLKHTRGEGERHLGHDTPGHAAQGERAGDGERTQIPTTGVAVPEKEEGAEGRHRQPKDEAEMLEENRLTVGVMQKLNLGAGLTEPKGQKGGGDAEEGGATALSPPHS
jgi:hypothetical protein